MKKYYVDASFNNQEQIGAYAIVQGEKYWTGIITHKEKINSGYCELYGINKALQLAQYDDYAIIYNDNTIVDWLNNDFYIQKHKKKDNGLRKPTFLFYHSLPNVEIKRVERKKVRIADQLARKTLKMELKHL